MAHSRPLQAHSHPASHPLWTTRSCTENDARFLSNRLTDATQDELHALSKFQPISILLQELGNKTVFVDSQRPNQPVALFDLKPMETGSMALWAVLSEPATRSETLWSLTSHARSILELMNRQHSFIFTFVDERNIHHLAWLEDLGFTKVQTMQFGRLELPFHQLQRKSFNHV